MKNILLVLSFGIGLFSFSKGDLPSEKGLYQQVRVNSDVEDLNIPKGKCVITGKVYVEVDLNGMGTQFVLCDSTRTAYFLQTKSEIFYKTDKFGAFNVELDTAVTYLLFMKSKAKVSMYEDIYFENYTFKSQHMIDVSVYIPLKSSHQNIIVDKPVIYAYSEKELNFTLNLKAKGELTFTYPQLTEDNTWKMKTNPNGNLITEKGVEYPYLFWEAKQNESSFNGAKANSNELIAGKDLVTYFEKELSKLGLNAKEKTDFITFWCPKFVDVKMVQIQFYVDDNCAIIGDLKISPKPDNFRRIYVTFQKNPDVEADFVSKELSVKTLDRTGFTVVEWGGSDLGSYVPTAIGI